ncbi:hypothetical protein G7046_g9126 [Stylonectria norvegica]|nr:hypothetical protein G7046_g9126 [Stylonectria norvegica]
MGPYDVLVTGSSGHLGTALMLSLPALGFHPLGIDILASENTNEVGSITDRDFIARVFKENPIKHVLHTATLHKPHICSHTNQDFIETNVTGTLVVLEEAAKLGSQIEGFIFISTTSAFGAALHPSPSAPAVWIDEEVVPLPKNVYGVTKVAAENMCFLIQKQTGMPIIIFRTSRFFPELDDDADRRAAMADDNLKVMELAYRRCDIQDIVQAIVLAMDKAKAIKWAKYIMSAPTPFTRDAFTLGLLQTNPQAVYRMVAPESEQVFADKGWKFLADIDRVYDSTKAVEELGWVPKYTFRHSLELIARGEDWRSELAKAVGKKGYHAVTTGIYTTR